MKILKLTIYQKVIFMKYLLNLVFIYVNLLFIFLNMTSFVLGPQLNETTFCHWVATVISHLHIYKWYEKWPIFPSHFAFVAFILTPITTATNSSQHMAVMFHYYSCSSPEMQILLTAKGHS